jgi:hypothetical protein
MFCKHPDNYVQRTAMHLLRCFRCTCLHLIDQAQCNDEQLMAFVDWVNPKTSNAFGALYAVYQIGNAVCVDSWPSFGACISNVLFAAKTLVARYGEVRVWNAEVGHRPEGNEEDPSSAMYVATGKETALCTFTKLRNVVRTGITNQSRRMDELGM